MILPKHETGGEGIGTRRSNHSVSEIRGLPHLNLDNKGGLRSLGILSGLVTERIKGMGLVGASRAVVELFWQPAQAFAGMVLLSNSHVIL